MICEYIIKRNGQKVKFESSKLFTGIFAAFKNSNPALGGVEIQELTAKTCNIIDERLNERGFNCIVAEDLQKITIESLNQLQSAGKRASEEFLRYALNRKEQRELLYLKKTLQTLTTSSAKDSDVKRENANVDGDTAMGTMLKYGSESAKSYNLAEVLPKEQSDAHINGDIHIHDLDFLTLTETCCQIPLPKLFNGGFSTGHGYLREPNGIASALALTAIAIQSNQNDQHGGQAIPCFDYYLAPYVTKEAKKQYVRCFSDVLADKFDYTTLEYSNAVEELKKCIDDYVKSGKSLLDEVQVISLAEDLSKRTDKSECNSTE